MKNIAFAKVGKQIKFLQGSYSPVGGDNEAQGFVRALANWNPDKKIYLVGRSDFKDLTETQRLALFPYDNVVDPWREFTEPWYTGHYPSGAGIFNPRMYDFIVRYLDDHRVKIDYALLIFGQMSPVTIPDKINRMDGEAEPVETIEMTKGYATPITTWLNASHVPYAEIVNDPRYRVNQSRDIFHLPELSLGQYDFEYQCRHIRSYEDQTLVFDTIRSRYAGMELAFCIGRDRPTVVSVNRKKKFVMILNEGKPTAYTQPFQVRSRYSTLRQWVLDVFPDVEVYGQWYCPEAKRDSRFMGSLHLERIQRFLTDVRYTLVVPIAPGWVTGKYIEMLHAGVVPFFHPSYDDQKHIPILEYLRVSSPAELKKKVEELDADPKLYREVTTEMLAVLKPEYYDGQFLSDTIMRAIHEKRGLRYERVDATNFEKKQKQLSLF